ncbi:hypothetical protein D3C76_1722120 [compost metagenome]
MPRSADASADKCFNFRDKYAVVIVMPKEDIICWAEVVIGVTRLTSSRGASFRIWELICISVKP